MYTKQDFKKWDSSPIERIHFKFWKRFLEVNNNVNKASNIADRAKLGRLLLLIPINQKIMKCFVYLNNKDNDSIVKQSFLMSKILHSMNNFGYYCKFINMFEQYNLTSLDTESLDTPNQPNCKNVVIEKWKKGKSQIEIN